MENGVFFSFKLSISVYLYWEDEKTRGPKGHCRSPEYNERERNFGMEPKITTLHPTLLDNCYTFGWLL